MDTITLKEDLTVGKIIIHKGTKLGLLDEDFRPNQVLFNTIKLDPSEQGGKALADSIVDVLEDLEAPLFLDGLMKELSTYNL